MEQQDALVIASAAPSKCFTFCHLGSNCFLMALPDQGAGSWAFASKW